MRTPEKTVSAEAEIRLWFRTNYPHHIPYDGPCSVSVICWTERKNADKKRAFPAKKPDLDNTCKLIFDAFNAIVWVDDSQVVSLHFVKRYAETGNAVGYSVSVEHLRTRDENEGKRPKKSLLAEFS
jgi:Holliday junction resolvase RusA-like endonuclease